MYEGDYLPSPGQDPSKLGGMGGFYNTLNFHAYGYAHNNPVKYVDPDGRTPGSRSSSPTSTSMFIGSDLDLFYALLGAGGGGVAFSLIRSSSSTLDTATITMGNPFPEDLRIPPGNRPQSPLGKGANSGPESINNPGDFGGSGFTPPSGLFGRLLAFLAGSSLLHDQCSNSLTDTQIISPSSQQTNLLVGSSSNSTVLSSQGNQGGRGQLTHGKLSPTIHLQLTSDGF